jgi:hypothetical protein
MLSFHLCCIYYTHIGSNNSIIFYKRGDFFIPIIDWSSTVNSSRWDIEWHPILNLDLQENLKQIFQQRWLQIWFTFLVSSKYRQFKIIRLQRNWTAIWRCGLRRSNFLGASKNVDSGLPYCIYSWKLCRAESRRGLMPLLCSETLSARVKMWTQAYITVGNVGSLSLVVSAILPLIRTSSFAH